MKKTKVEKAFELEIEAWCYGLTQYPGEIYPALVHAVVKELTPAFANAIKHGIIFDVVEVAQTICKSSKYLVNDKEIVFSILVRLPSPNDLNSEDELYALAAVLDKVEQTHTGAIQRMEKRWANLQKAA